MSALYSNKQFTDAVAKYESLKKSKESSAKKEIEALNKFIESIDKQ